MSDSNTIDLNKNKGMRALMIISNQVECSFWIICFIRFYGSVKDSKNPNATKHAAAEMAIDKVNQKVTSLLSV